MAILGAFVVPHPPLIIKEIGKGEEIIVKKTIDSYHEIAKIVKELKPDTIIISSPHTILNYDSFSILGEQKLTGLFKRFGCSEVSFEEQNDIELVKEIISLSNNEVVESPKETKLDHGTMVPLYFIEQEYKDFQLVVIGLSGKSYYEHYKIGKIIQEAIENTNRRVVYIASGDLSHKQQEYGPYGFVEEGPIYDNRIMDILRNSRFNELLTFDEKLCRKASECGHRSFIMMAGALDGIEVKAEELSHENTTGVGYGIVTYQIIGKSNNRFFLKEYLINEKERIRKQRENADIYVKLAVETIYEYIKNQRVIECPKDLPKELIENKRGTFVTIYKMNRLRGCIGTILPSRENIAAEIIGNAISAATSDYRFSEVKEEELDYLEIHVDVLSPLQVVDSIEDLDVKKYGIVVKSGFKKGVLLPNLQSIETVEEQIEVAKEKGNISENENYTIERFEVIRHE
ncbi:MAG: AmmeMemoRadiSam system protein A [Bacilli bacterium]|nr:AmmeMemoRadiSam system protein A [Bacilli bacterium]